MTMSCKVSSLNWIIYLTLGS
ncbi:hypothetical protein Pint_35687 [Pistacia integerrima]|uniref:Uncharacterized protein n=1 Tax=Pistacia integerrima TaxID=434235 RepID=A0ACC0Y2V1_9ROSI|nr:hypothetical protein Pint_35687 [Pistacia integerrima]